MSKPQSAIDEIFKIGKSVEDLKSKIDFLEKNIKSLNNKFIILTKKVDAINSTPKETAEPKSYPSANVADKELKSKINKEENISDKLVLGSVKTYGYIVDTNRKPISEIIVAIFDKDNSKIRSIKTNADGYWEARLPSGHYKVIYSHKNFNDVVKEINIPKGTANFRVN